MNHYTVLLLRPDYIAGAFGKDTYLVYVMANGPLAAIKAAQIEVRDIDLDDSTPPDDVDINDYHPLLCILGHHEDLTPDWEEPK
jgi:hypothetical protein